MNSWFPCCSRGMSQAEAVNLFGKGYALPEAFSLHSSFYLWLPQGNMPETTIALSYTVGDFFEPYFEEVVEIRRIDNPYAEASVSADLRFGARFIMEL